MDPRDFEIEFEFDKNLVLNSTTFERSVLTRDPRTARFELVRKVIFIGAPARTERL